MAGTDLFTWLDALWNKTKPPGTPPIYIMHRFLASNRDFAPAARFLQSDLRREPDLVMGTWQALLPRGKGAPRLSYAAPKKGPEAELLTQRMMVVLGERRDIVEDIQALVAEELAARGQQLVDLYLYYGVEPPEVVAEQLEPALRKRTGGLFDLLDLEKEE